MSAAIGQVVSFADRGATLALPPGYTYAFEDKGKTIVVRPPTRGAFEFRLTFNSLAQLEGRRPTIAREFVADAAKKNGRQLGRIRGTDSFGFFEAAGGSMVKGEPARKMSGLITLGQGYVTLVLTIPEKNAATPAVRDFLQGGMEALLGGLRPAKSVKLPEKDARKTTRAPDGEKGKS